LTGRWRFVLLLAALSAACASSDNRTATPSTAQVGVAGVSPAAGSALQQSSVLEATVDYTISNFHPKADAYYLVIAFEGANGKPFHDYERIADQPILGEAHGSLVVTHTLANAWADSRLKKPIRLWFEVVVRTGANDSAVIGRSAPVEYAAR
jgi:hypothetical protein